ncbi:unnamed protein product [Arctogadus glacialis]
MSAGSMRLNHTTSAAWLRLLLRGQPTCRPALQVRGVSAVQPGTSAPDEAAARDPHAPPLFSRSRTGRFFQAQPQLKNPFLEDPLLGRYLRRHLPPQGRLEGIEVQRLKDKLGTRQMPTAELLLDGLPAHRVSGSPPTPHPGG